MSYFNSYELNCRTTEKFGGDRHCGYTDYYLSFPNLNHNKKEMIQAIEALMKKDIAAVSSRSSTKILRTAAYPPASSSSSRQSQATPWAGQNTVFSFSD